MRPVRCLAHVRSLCCPHEFWLHQTRRVPSPLALQAETVARSITDPYQQAQALTAVAEAIAAAGDPDRAGRLLGAVLAVALWQVSLPVLAKHWPQVVLQCADGLSGNERSRYTEL